MKFIYLLTIIKNRLPLFKFFTLFILQAIIVQQIYL